MSLRSYRIAGMAIFDWVATIISAYILFIIGHRHGYWRAYNWFDQALTCLIILFILVVLSIPLHRLFHVDSVLTNALLGSEIQN